MKNIMKKITAVSLLSATLLSSSLVANTTYTLLNQPGPDAKAGIGYCKGMQDGSTINARVRTTNLTPSVIASTWIKVFDENKNQIGSAFQLDNTVSSTTGDATFKGSFELIDEAYYYSLTVKDHFTIIDGVENDELLTLDLEASKNPSGDSETTGVCTFEIVK